MVIFLLSASFEFLVINVQLIISSLFCKFVVLLFSTLLFHETWGILEGMGRSLVR